jgi:hypothetical protein
MIGDEVNMNSGTVNLILTEELRIKKVIPRWCPGISQINSGMRG